MAAQPLVDQVGRGVVGAGGLALRPPGQLEAGRVVRREERVEVQQTFVDAPQFLHVQGGVVDAPPGGALILPVHGEVPDGPQEVPVGEEEVVQKRRPLGVKEVAVQRGDVQEPGQVLVLEEAEGGLQAQPEVGVFVVRFRDAGALPQAGDAVVVTVDGAGGDAAISSVR